MNAEYKIIIAGAGGIAEAAALMLMEMSEIPPIIYLGNRHLEKAKKVCEWVKDGASRPVKMQAFKLEAGEVNLDTEQIFQEADILLDCLPGSQAPGLAKLALEYELHYANLTEYIKETEQIIAMTMNATTGFVLQTGLAPGYINVLAHKLFLDFCRENGTEKVDRLEMKVGALGLNAVAPHFYGFTWSPVGVATEYMQPATTLRDFKIRSLPALSDRQRIIIDGIAYEEALTSGGAADLPIALEEKVRNLDYKTLRHPGHYAWVEKQLEGSSGKISQLQEKMENAIPHLETDQVVLYAAVEGRDRNAMLMRREVSRKILPMKFGKHELRAIQVTTAAPLLQCAQFLLENNPRGVILQSEIDTDEFLNGNFVKPVYGDLMKDLI